MSIQEKLVGSGTNMANGTARYFSASHDVAGVTDATMLGSPIGDGRRLMIQFVVTAITVTVEAMIEGSATWVDITKTGRSLNSNTDGNATYTASDLVDFGRLGASAWRVKAVPSNATNSWKLAVRVEK